MSASPDALWSGPAHPWVTAATERPRFGVAYGPFSDWSACRDWAQMIEALGFDSFWLPDHPVRNADPFTTLAALAVSTRTLRLGVLTSCVAYRSPVLLARQAADIDRLSEGRLVLGLGIGDYEREFAQLGVAYGSVAERQALLAETIQVIQGAWGSAPFSFQGRSLQVTDCQLRPGPVQQPRIPLLIAGGGERVTLRQVAQAADMSNMAAHAWTGSAFSSEDIQRKYAALERYCQMYGRPFSTVLRSHLSLPLVLAESPAAVERKLGRLPDQLRNFWQTSLVAGTPDTVTVHFQRLMAAGVNYFIVGFLRGALEHDRETLALLSGEVLPALGRG